MRLRDLLDDFDDLEDVRLRVEAAVDPDAPAALSAGGVIRPGFSEELDELRRLRDGAVECWGLDSLGRLGLGTGPGVWWPVELAEAAE